MMPQQSNASKDAALRAVGRTVVNFQRLEHNLKLAARLSPLEGTASRIQRLLEKRLERSTTLTLGQAIKAWLEFTQGESSNATHFPVLFDVTMKVSFSLEWDAESRRSHALALESLLETRNKLVHGRLAQFDWECRRACEQLVKDLEGVNDEIGVQMDFITSILSLFKSLRPDQLEAELLRQLGADAVVTNHS